jgi:ribosomal protein L33
MQCKCGREMIDRKQVIHKEPINYMHCKGCSRNYVSEINKKKIAILNISDYFKALF